LEVKSRAIKAIKLSIVTVSAAALCAVFVVVRQALLAEERLIAVVSVIELVDGYVRQSNGKWPPDWMSLKSFASASRLHEESDIARLQRFVEIDFSCKTCDVGAADATTFEGIRPVGACSKSYEHQLERLIAIAHEFCN
jgi:hypothetical protein